MKRYTREELRLLKSDLPDHVVAAELKRTTMAIYCKRWSLQKCKTESRKKEIVRTVVDKVYNENINRIVLGNVTIDVKGKTLIINL